MKPAPRLVMLLPLACLLGCTLPSTPSTTGTPPAPTGNWDNWQIQAGAAITSPPAGLYFVGAIQVQGTQSAAVFTSAGPVGSGPATVLDFLGTYNPTGAVDLLPATTNSAAYGIGFTEPSTNTVIPIGIVSGCVYPLDYTGVECLALISLSPAVGVQIASLNGTYVGTLTDSSSPTLSGTAALVLTQSTAPNSSGQFPLSGTITFPSGSGFGTAPLAGTVLGEAISLSDPSAAPNSPSITLTASANPTATQINISNLAYSGSGTSATFTGTLTRQ